MGSRFKDTFLDMSKRQAVITPPAMALRRVTSRSGLGVFASADTLYKGAVFGRDSLEVADDLMDIKPRLVRNILLTLASLQGTKFNASSEEEPGKIVHEYRNIVTDGKPIDDVSMKIFTQLSSKWGGTDEEMAYYGSVDATPQFLRVLGSYCLTYGPTILDKKVSLRDGSVETVRGVGHKAVEWVMGKIDHSDSGLLEYRKMNPQGISNQVWKDSEEFYVHENGDTVDHSAPIASIEVQGLAYDGLLAATTLFSDQADSYSNAAEKLRARTFDMLWQPSRNSFALGVNSSDEHETKVIRTAAANQAALLDSAIFDDLPVAEKQKYITAIIQTILSSEFLTDAGIRSRSISSAGLVSHWDYHGSFVSWPKETYDIAKGLRRQGFPKLARQLENRILNVCLKYKAYPEFVYVDAHGRVLASPPSTRAHGDFVVIEGTNQPEHLQAWTISAVTAIISGRLKNKLKFDKSSGQEQWQIDLENKMLSTIPDVNRYFNPYLLRVRYPAYRYVLKPKES